MNFGPRQSLQLGLEHRHRLSFAAFSRPHELIKNKHVIYRQSNHNGLAPAMFGYDLFGHAMSPSETNFTQITQQMFLAHIMKYALLSSFQQRIKRSGSMVMHITACKLFRAGVYLTVGRIVFSDLLISPILIGHQVRLLVDKTFNQSTKLGGLITGNQCRADLALAFGR